MDTSRIGWAHLLSDIIGFLQATAADEFEYGLRHLSLRMRHVPSDVVNRLLSFISEAMRAPSFQSFESNKKNPDSFRSKGCALPTRLRSFSLIVYGSIEVPEPHLLSLPNVTDYLKIELSRCPRSADRLSPSPL